MIPPAEALSLARLITPVEGGIASRLLAKSSGAVVTLFAFAEGQGLSEHSTPFDALVLVIGGELRLTVGGATVAAVPGTVVRLPANVPHAVAAPVPARMLLVMLKDTAAQSAPRPAAISGAAT